MTRDELREQMAAVAAAEAESLAETLPAPDAEFVGECLQMEERGDGILFAELHRGKFVCVENWGKSGTWLRWTGHHWEIDRRNLVHDAVEAVALTYLQFAGGLAESITTARTRLSGAENALRSLAEGDADAVAGPQAQAEAEKNQYLSELSGLNRRKKSALKRVDRLRRMSGATNCLSWAHKIGVERSLTILGDDIDAHPWLLACPNGVLDLRTGAFGPSRQDDYLLRSIAVPWEGPDATCPTWDAFIEEIHQGDREIIAYLDRLFGYCLTGQNSEHFIGCFLGEGRNGKGTMFEVLKELMGDLGWSIQSEMLMENKGGRSSTGPSPDLFDLQGKRFVVASESDKNRRISLSMVKTLTGGDTINARRPFDTDGTNFRPTWKLFLYTNHVPTNITEDFAMQQRLIYIRYPLQFVDSPDPANPLQRKRDPDLPKKLRAELPGILARYVRGCLEWQRSGLCPPERIRKSVDELTKAQDIIRAWFEDNCETAPGHKATVAELGDSLAAYYDAEVGGPERFRPTKRALSQWLFHRGFERDRTGGVSAFLGLRLAQAETGGWP